MKLSILVGSLENHNYLLKRILSLIEPQLTKEVELLIEVDNGELSTGAKRQVQLNKANGDYVICVDDDDIIPGYYVSEILTALESNPDCAAMNGIITQDGKNPYPFYHSIKYSHWFTNDQGHFRCPNHLNPVKRELALLAGWEDLRYGSDQGFSMRLLPLLKTETTITKCLYYYLAKTRLEI